MISLISLKDAGYRELKDSDSMATSCWQKKVWGVHAGHEHVLYFINVYYYSFEHLDVMNGEGAHAFELKMSFDCDNEASPYCWITRQLVPTCTMDQMEQLADQIWRNNQGKIYE